MNLEPLQMQKPRTAWRKTVQVLIWRNNCPTSDCVGREKNRPHPVGSGYLETVGKENYRTNEKKKKNCFLKSKHFIIYLQRSNLRYIQEYHSKNICHCYIKVCLGYPCKKVHIILNFMWVQLLSTNFFMVFTMSLVKEFILLLLNMDTLTGYHSREVSEHQSGQNQRSMGT